MDVTDRSDPSPVALAVQAAVASTLLGFLLAAAKNPHIHDHAFSLIAATVAGSFGSRWLPSNRTLAIIGAAVAITASWLLPQRDDLAAAAILAFLFTLGVCVAADLWGSGRRRPRAVRYADIASIVVMFALYFLVSQKVLLGLLVAVVVAATAATVSGRLPARTSTRGRAIAYGTVLVATTLIFTAYVGAETPDATWFGGGAVHGPRNIGQVALTFDDGPNFSASEKVMAILDAHGVKGTFFEVGKAIDAAPKITRALYNDGQLLGNHSYEHDQWRWLDPAYPELQRTQAAFQRAIGTCPVLYRPPHGDRTPFLAQVVRDHHMQMVLWSASAGDWATNDAHLVARRILDGARPGAILLLHDGLDGNPSANRTVLVRALPLILDGLRAKGLTPVRLDHLLGTEAYQSC